MWDKIRQDKKRECNVWQSRTRQEHISKYNLRQQKTRQEHSTQYNIREGETRQDTQYTRIQGKNSVIEHNLESEYKTIYDTKRQHDIRQNQSIQDKTN